MNIDANNDDFPVISIQCDWEDFIQIPLKTIWVSCKFLNQSSEHARIQGGTLLSDNPNFSFNLEKNSATVKYIPTGHCCRFIPAYKVFNKVHTKGILSLDASDGGLGVSSCRDGKLLVWDYATGQVKLTLTGHAGDVYKCRLFPSGVVVLSAGADTQIKIWSAENGQCPVTLTGHARAITGIEIIERGRNIISISKDGTSKLWHCGNGVCIDTILTTQSTLTCCSIGIIPDSLKPTKPDNDLEIATDNKILLVGSEEGHIHASVISTRKILYSIDAGASVNDILYFSKDRFVAGTQDGKILVYNLQNGSIVSKIHESNSPVLSLRGFREKGILVGRHDGTVNYYGMFSNNDRLQLTGSDCEPITAISVTTSNIFTGCRDGKIRKYKVSDLSASGI